MPASMPLDTGLDAGATRPAAPVTVAVVGLGFSGTAVAIHLMRLLPEGAQLLLVEPDPQPGRGLAYGTRCASHWLNVPAGQLGWDPSHASGFIDWLQSRHGGYAPGDFVPRMLLGDYMAQALATGQQWARSRGVRVRRLCARVAAIDSLAGQPHVLRLDDGSAWPADRIVLATGHLAPEQPALAGGPRWGEAGLIHEPWGERALAELPEDGEVLLLGSGLSAIDLLTWLQDRGHQGRVTLLSRRGLLPQSHRGLEARPCAGLAVGPMLTAQRSLTAMLRQVRRWAAEAGTEGQDWRDVMASLRACTPRLWQQLSLRERRQFLRHLQPWWDTHRHRLAPGIHRRLQAALCAGQVELHAGRLDRVERSSDGRLDVAWRMRGTGELRHRRVAALVNCTGPSARVGRAAPGSLMASLQAQGRLCADPLGLGLQVDGAHALLDAVGRPQAGLYYVGPLLKAQHWEAIAVPELRVHARDVAREVASTLVLPATA